MKCLKRLLRRQRDRICKESMRASETCEESSERREQNRTRMMSTRASETCEETTERREQNRTRMMSTRASETCEEITERREQNRTRMMSTRASETCEETTERRESQIVPRVCTLVLFGKVVMRIVKYDLQDSVGSIQLCASQDAGCEAAVHAMDQVFADEDTEAMILVDASNTFNCLNRQVTLLNCETICHALLHILKNTYRNNSQLFVDGQCILSKEGTTQGDPLAMAMYAIGTQPLIRRLDSIAKQVWYADDSAAG